MMHLQPARCLVSTLGWTMGVMAESGGLQPFARPPACSKWPWSPCRNMTGCSPIGPPAAADTATPLVQVPVALLNTSRYDHHFAPAAVGNLSYDLTEQDVIDHFSQVGPVKHVRRVRPRVG